MRVVLQETKPAVVFLAVRGGVNDDIHQAIWVTMVVIQIVRV